MAGEESHRVQVGVFNPTTRSVCYLQTGDPTDRYFTNLSWSPDERTLYLIEVNRDQNHARLDAYDAPTGRHLRTLFEESDPKYFEPCAPIRFLPWDATRFVHLSRRDGFLHLYLYRLDRQGEARLERQLTSGPFEVFDIVGFNTREHTVLFTSNRSLQTGCTTHAVSLAGRITPVGGQQGWHTPKASAEGTLLADNWQSPDVARRIDLVGTRAGQQPVSYFQAADPWEGYAVPDIRVGTIKAADGTTDLHYRLILPTDFDPTRKYPAIIYVYGGPHAHVVDATRNYGARGWDIWMAQRGYVMLSLDNRGSEHRGRDFEQATFRQLGVEEMKDQLEGVRLLKSLPYVDADRLGVHGWSFGGYMTTSLLTTYPGTFKVGVAGGPVIDWRYYEVMYGERYMDTPQANPEGYERTSLIKKAGNLRDRLLIIYGGNDPTCVPQHTLSFLKACVEAGTHPDLFIYPGHGHNMTGTDRVHLHEHITRYFDDFLRR
jgi:dipeptidyl-peptidase-4